MSTNPATIGNTPYTDSAQGPTYPQHISWLTASDFINYPNGLGFTPNSPAYLNGSLQRICDAACTIAEKYCNRYFSNQTIDEVSPDVNIQYGRITTVSLENSPILSVNNIWLQVIQYFNVISLQYMTVFHKQGYYQIVPYLTGVGSGGGVAVPVSSLDQGVCTFWTNYTFGFTAENMPDDIYFASTLIATKLVAMQQNPIGASMMEMGKTKFEWHYVLGQDDEMTKQVKALLDPHRSLQFYTV